MKEDLSVLTLLISYFSCSLCKNTPSICWLFLYVFIKFKQSTKKNNESLIMNHSSLFSAGVDPKSVLCAFFKQGQCTKGDRCKFSHDLSMERKCEKKSVYVDERDEELEKGQCTL